ncbi:uncharacterized protein LOC121415880 [Lytechinus variegatus]|uniref:uncharacterized protein LOC121415880 n=1 Tax=Lytechinus variegatus TaxID=7654 RepID=UPI001BB10CB0|nr:uncharacterized protein LOC121415880 [Lytechinus variegatus]
MILNLKKLNRFIENKPFKMECLSKILPLLRPHDWAASIDLSDVYLHVPITRSSQHLLGFAIGGDTYQYQALPFGLRSAPRFFTRLVRVIAAELRRRGKNFFLLSGRLVDPRPLRTNPSQTLEGHNRVNDKFRPSHKLRKIKIDSNSDSGFPWSIYRHPASGGSPPSPPGSENESSRGATPVQSSLDCEDLADFSGTLSKLSEYSPPLQTEDEFSHKQFGDDCGAVSPPTLCIRDSGKVCPDKVRQPDGGNISHSRLLIEGALSPLGMDAPRGCGQGDIQSFQQPTDRSICLNTTRDPALLPRAQQTEAHTVAHYRAAAIKAGLSERAANFSAERLRSSTRSTYDSRLSHYVRWCWQAKTNPCRASVGLSRRILSLVGLWRQ